MKLPLLEKIMGENNSNRKGQSQDERDAEIVFLFDSMKRAGVRTADASHAVRALKQMTSRELLGLFSSSPEYGYALLKIIAHFLPRSTGPMDGLRPEVSARIESSPEYAQSVIDYAAARNLTNPSDITTGGVDEAVSTAVPLRDGAL